MTMPEASVNKYDCSIFWENQVRLARQCSIIKFISEAFSEKELSYKDFRPGIPAPDP